MHQVSTASAALLIIYESFFKAYIAKTKPHHRIMNYILSLES